jgi:predicted CXXCH cytochrome family protein
MLKSQRKHTSLFLLIAVLAFFVSCSTQNHYKTLSFFFDGVPQPEKTDSISTLDKMAVKDTTSHIALVKTAIIKGSIHQPYKDGNCSSCHNEQAAGMFKTPLPGLCYSCHEDFSKKFAFVHGPVAVGYCNGCHNPHSSELPKLLVSSGQALCYNCHDAASVLKNEVHAEIGETKCTDCHNPHGGSDRFLF